MVESNEKDTEMPADPATYAADKVITANANPAQPVDPSTARKRRKAIIESQRKESEEAAQQKESENEGVKTNKGKSATTSSGDEGQGDDGEDSDGSEGSMQPNGKRRKNKKTQIRYDPDVPMSKEQLAAWRREARRVRNRESAAASRQRIRSRINELETEVDEYKLKYHAALDRLKELEELAKNGAAGGEAGAASEMKSTEV